MAPCVTPGSILFAAHLDRTLNSRGLLALQAPLLHALLLPLTAAKLRLGVVEGVGGCHLSTRSLRQGCSITDQELFGMEIHDDKLLRNVAGNCFSPNTIIVAILRVMAELAKLAWLGWVSRSVSSNLAKHLALGSALACTPSVSICRTVMSNEFSPTGASVAAT